MKDDALDRTVWRARFGRGSGPDVRQDYLMNEYFLGPTQPPIQWVPGYSPEGNETGA
jgi:hypothetical protein